MKPEFIENYNPDKPYTTGSGVVLGGVDMGEVDKSFIRQTYYPLVEKGLWTESQYKALEKSAGLKGLMAKEYMERNRILSTIRISKKKANRVLASVN